MMQPFMQRRTLKTMTKPPGTWRLIWDWAFPIAAISAAVASVIVSIHRGEPTEGLVAVMAAEFAWAILISIHALRICLTESFRAKRFIRALESKPIHEVLAEFELKSGLIGHVVRALYRRSRLRSDDLDPEPLLCAVHRRLSDPVSQVRLHCGLLISIGAIGTVVGLLLMAQGITEAVTRAEGGADLMLTLFSPGGAMSGLSAAFITTLVGSILGGTVLRCLAYGQERWIKTFISHYGELIREYIVPDLRRRRDDPGGSTQVFLRG